MAPQPFVGPCPLFQFLDLIHSRYGSLDGGSARRKAYTYTQNNTNAESRHKIQTSMPCVGFESTIPALDQAAFDRVATVIGRKQIISLKTERE
jgi:uncharacterized protein YraI